MEKKIAGIIAIILTCCVLAFAQDAPSEPGSFEIYPDSELYNQFYTHREAEQHYYHCSLSNFQLWDSLQDCRNPSGPVEECDKARAWENGNLWKPKSDNTGNPVVLVEEHFKSANCHVVTEQESIPCRFRTVANGNRAHFDVFRHCSSLDSLIFKLELNGVSYCWAVPEPCHRYD